MNDKGISDALLNGISDCLRSLQRSSPGLLLTAHQLKKVERDVKYIPLVAASMVSIICGGSRSRLDDHAHRIITTWDDAVEPCEEMCVNRLEHAELTQQDNPVQLNTLDNRIKVDALHQAIERRLRLIVSDEFKSSKLADEKELRRQNRADLATTKKRTKTNEAVDSELFEKDCFESDDTCSSEEWKQSSPGRFDSPSVGNNLYCESQCGSST